MVEIKCTIAIKSATGSSTIYGVYDFMDMLKVGADAKDFHLQASYPLTDRNNLNITLISKGTSG